MGGEGWVTKVPAKRYWSLVTLNLAVGYAFRHALASIRDQVLPINISTLLSVSSFRWKSEGDGFSQRIRRTP